MVEDFKLPVFNWWKILYCLFFNGGKFYTFKNLLCLIFMYKIFHAWYSKIFQPSKTSVYKIFCQKLSSFPLKPGICKLKNFFSTLYFTQFCRKLISQVLLKP